MYNVKSQELLHLTESKMLSIVKYSFVSCVTEKEKRLSNIPFLSLDYVHFNSKNTKI